MSVTLSLFAGAGAQFLDNNGLPLSGGKIYTYSAGTTTPLATYTTNLGTVAQANPIILNASGRIPVGELWLTTGYGYKFVVKDANEVLIGTYDNVPSSAQPPITNDASSIYYEEGYSLTAGSFVIGDTYLITSIGSTNFQLIGAIANTVGIYFIATGIGSGTGTAQFSRTLQNKLKDEVSVKDFGAIGNGIIDDTISVQAAINASTNVYFPEGTYLLKNVLIPANTNLYGNNDATLLLAICSATDYSPIFNLQGNNTSFKGLLFNGNRINQPPNSSPVDGWGGLTGSGKANRDAIYGDILSTTVALNGLTILNCQFTQFQGASIATRDFSDILIDGCVFYDNTFESGLFYEQYSYPVAHTNIKITNCSSTNIFSGYTYVNADVFVVSGYVGVIFTGNSAVNYERLSIKCEASSNIIIANNYAKDASLYGGIGCQGGGNNLSINNNILINVPGGIGLGGLAGTNFNNAVICNNTIDNTNLSYPLISTPDGISVNYCNNLTITDNILLNIVRMGISINNNLTGLVSFQNNVITLRSGTPLTHSCIGMTLTNDLDSLSISGNVLSQGTDTTDGIISIEGAYEINRLDISNNVIKGNSTPARSIFCIYATLTGFISNNVCPDGLLELYPATGSSLVVQNNVSPQVLVNAGSPTFARVLPANTAPPTTGIYYQGDAFYNSVPTSGSYIGWVCTAYGTPGTWAGFGLIA